MQGLHSNSALFWTPEKAGLRYPLLIVSLPLALGTRENAGHRKGRVGVATSLFFFGHGGPPPKTMH